MMILITGGSKCGKSSLAERLALELSGDGPRCYLATMQVRDGEDQQIVRRHQLAREGKGFQVIERPRGLAELCTADQPLILLEDVPNLLANEMFGGAGEEAAYVGVHSLRQRCPHLIAVTNEVGSDGADYLPETLAYIDALGRLNAQLAQLADAVLEVVAGQPIMLKGALP